MVHQGKPYGSVGLTFLYYAPGRQAFVHHRGREQLVPAALRPGRQKRPCGAFLERGRVPGGCGGQQGLTGGGSLTESVGLLFCCYSPGRRVGASSGTRTAAKAAAACGGNREPEPGPRSQSRRPAQGALADAGTATCRASPPCVPAGKNGAVDHFRAQVPPQPDWPERGLYHPLRGGLMRRASACIRLAGTGR